MTVKYTRPEYDAMVSRWKMCRDAIAGQYAVQAASKTYLPQLSDQTEGDYKAYLKRTVWYNASWRTIYGLTGMMFRKPPVTTFPESGKTLLEDVTLQNVPVEMFAKDIALEVLSVGRVGILVDFPSSDPYAARTVADAEKLNLRPIMRKYSTESIINWKTTTLNNKQTLSMVVLAETASLPKDEFEDTTQQQWRVLDLDLAFGGAYRVRTFILDKNGKELLISTVYPQMNGAFMTEIPFVFVTPDGICYDIDEPPMIDLVDVNMSHYRTTADYEHGCHFTGLPTPWVAGYDGVDEKTGKVDKSFYIGSMTAWVFPNPLTKVGFLEFTGTGLNALKDNLDRKESQMAILGARMIAQEKKQAETATTTAIHRTGENSILSAIAISVSMAITKALEIFAEWSSLGKPNEDIKFEINREFTPVPIDAPMLLAMVKAWQASAMPIDTVLDMLQRGDIEDAETTLEDYLAAIKKNAPPPPPIDPNTIDPKTGQPYPKPAPAGGPAGA